MVNLAFLAKYPFTKQAAKYTSRLSISPLELAYGKAYGAARRRGKERVIQTIQHGIIYGKSQNPLIELLSYPTARILISLINDNYLLRRYALAEAKHTYLYLQEESLTQLSELAERNFKINIRPDKPIKIHFTDYLKHTPHAPKWKLINRTLENGFISLTHRELARLLQEAIRKKILSELPLNIPRILSEPYKDDLKDIQKLLAKRKMQLRPAEVVKGEIVQEAFPPCMAKIILDLKSVQNVPHHARFAITAFLINIGMDIADIVDLFNVSPDFDVDRTRYQVEHIAGVRGAGTKYTPPSCSAMKTYGICPGGDGLCEEVNHPLNYYFKKIKKGRR